MMVSNQNCHHVHRHHAVTTTSIRIPILRTLEDDLEQKHLVSEEEEEDSEDQEGGIRRIKINSPRLSQLERTSTIEASCIANNNDHGKRQQEQEQNDQNASPKTPPHDPQQMNCRTASRAQASSTEIGGHERLFATTPFRYQNSDGLYAASSNHGRDNVTRNGNNCKLKCRNGAYDTFRNNNSGDTNSLLSKSLGTVTGFGSALHNRFSVQMSASPSAKNTDKVSPTISINHRRISDVSSITYSGYLLKRSNKPYQFQDNQELHLHHVEGITSYPFPTDEDENDDDGHNFNRSTKYSWDDVHKNDYENEDNCCLFGQTQTFSQSRFYGVDNCTAGTPEAKDNELHYYNKRHGFVSHIASNCISTNLASQDPKLQLLQQDVKKTTSAEITSSTTSIFSAPQPPVTLLSSQTIATAPNNNDVLTSIVRPDPAMQFVASIFGLHDALLPPSATKDYQNCKETAEKIRAIPPPDNGFNILETEQKQNQLVPAIYTTENHQFHLAENQLNQEGETSASTDSSLKLHQRKPQHDYIDLEPPIPVRIPYDSCYIRSVSENGYIPRQPPDYIDPNDGHIWRAKYCVLDGECLFFYSHEVVAHSTEAVLERQRWKFEDATMESYQDDKHLPQQVQPEYHPLKKSSSAMLSQSPMPRHNMLHLADNNDTNNNVKCVIHDRESFSPVSHHSVFEKVVALECVGAVRSAELEYGPNSFELSAVGSGSASNGVEDEDEDKLVLRAQNKDEMSEWLFQFHRSIATFVRDIMNQIQHRIFHGTPIMDVRLPTLPLNVSAGSKLNDCNKSTTATQLPVAIQSSSSPSSPPSTSSYFLARTTTTNITDYSETNSGVDALSTPTLIRRVGDRGDGAASLTPHTSSTGSEDSPARGSYSVAAFSPRYHKIIYGSGPGSSNTAFSLSHGHGRNSIHRRRGGSFCAGSNASSVSTAPLIPMPSSDLLRTSYDNDDAILDSAMQPALVHDPVFGLDGIDLAASVTPTPRNAEACTLNATESLSHFMLPMQSNQLSIESTKQQHHVLPLDVLPKLPVPEITRSCGAGKYIPPHLRRKGISSGDTALSTGQKYVPPHLRSATVKGVPQNCGAELESCPTSESISESGYIPRYVRANGNTVNPTGEITSPTIIPPSETKNYHGDSMGREADDSSSSDAIVTLGGCADPLHRQGSILDKRYIPSESSKLEKVRAVPHGHFSNHSSLHRHGTDIGSISTIGNRERGTTKKPLWTSPLQWEIGAVSECGIRATNQDSYLVTSNLLDVFAQFENANAAQNSTDSASSTVWDQEGMLHPPGLFAIFDGHCGDHASRFAAELITSFIHKESHGSRKSVVNELQNRSADTDEVELILDRAIRSLDTAFCNLCVQDERAWYSGSTALVATVFNEYLIVANLGDSRGVMGRSVASADAPEYVKQGWNQLPAEENHETDKKYLWKVVTALHSPGQDEEQLRIRSANGWVTTEKEIPVSQLQRMALYDDDVIDILKRCFADHYSYTGSTNSTSPSKVPPSVNEKPSSSPQPTSRASAPQRILEISRVCGELAVSRALGDRDFKSAFQLQTTQLLHGNTSKTNSGTSNQHEENGSRTSPSDTIVWQSNMCLPYPPNHSGIFSGDLVSNVPEFTTIRIGLPNVYDEFLLLACDGLFDVMDPDDAYRVAHGLLFDKKWSAKKTAARLAELAIHLGSSDNITVVVVRFFHAPPES